MYMEAKCFCILTVDIKHTLSLGVIPAIELVGELNVLMHSLFRNPKQQEAELRMKLQCQHAGEGAASVLTGLIYLIHVQYTFGKTNGS